MKPSTLALFLLITTPALADRPVEPRKDATHVVTGMVEAIYSRQGRNYVSYIVEIRVAAVEKGAGVKPGDLFRTSCYRRKDGVPGSLDADSDGHATIPKEGQEIRVFVKDQKGQFEGVYPDWVDVLKPKPG